MKFVCMLALISVAVCLTHAQEGGGFKEDEFEEVEVTTLFGKHKPGHGKCRRYPFRFCRYPGEKTRFDGEKCLICKCNKLFGETCCEGEPRPVVKKPRHCDVTLNRRTCEYDLHPRCKDACVAVGWHVSILADYDDGWYTEDVE